MPINLADYPYLQQLSAREKELKWLLSELLPRHAHLLNAPAVLLVNVLPQLTISNLLNLSTDLSELRRAILKRLDNISEQYHTSLREGLDDVAAAEKSGLTELASYVKQHTMAGSTVTVALENYQFEQSPAYQLKYVRQLADKVDPDTKWLLTQLTLAQAHAISRPALLLVNLQNAFRIVDLLELSVSSKLNEEIFTTLDNISKQYHARASLKALQDDPAAAATLESDLTEMSSYLKQHVRSGSTIIQALEQYQREIVPTRLDLQKPVSKPGPLPPLLSLRVFKQFRKALDKIKKDREQKDESRLALAEAGVSRRPRIKQSKTTLFLEVPQSTGSNENLSREPRPSEGSHPEAAAGLSATPRATRRG